MIIVVEASARRVNRRGARRCFRVLDQSELPNCATRLKHGSHAGRTPMDGLEGRFRAEPDEVVWLV